MGYILTIVIACTMGYMYFIGRDDGYLEGKKEKNTKKKAKK